MSIWGKIIGGVAGFAVGGPLGALLGAAAGHAVDKMRASPVDGDADARQVTFTIAVIVLSAKMAKVDGRVTRSEIDAFKTLFRIPAEEAKNVGRLFNEARQEAAGFEPYAEQVAHMFAHEPAVLEELLGGLFHIARADAEVKKVYRKLIRENHPDSLIAQGMPQEFIDVANQKMATINAAYDRVEKQRGLT